MQWQVNQIHRKLQRLRERMIEAQLAKLWQALTEYERTGKLPTAPMPKAFIEMCRASEKAMDLSIGGDSAEHEAACREFDQAYERWGRAVRAEL